MQDARAITERAHEVGALVVLDTYQSAGTVPFSVKELDVDFATGGSVKWLCGGPGAGYLYVAPRLQQKLEPKVTGWMAHAAPFAFEDAPIRYADSIARFLHGSPAIPALYAAESGYKIINQIGVEKIRAKSVRQTQTLIALADAAAQEKAVVPLLPPRFTARRREGLEAAVQRALELPAAQWPHRNRPAGHRPSPAEKRRYDALRQRRDRRAAELNIDPTLIASRATLSALARDWEKHQGGLMRWQRELLRE